MLSSNRLAEIGVGLLLAIASTAFALICLEGGARLLGVHSESPMIPAPANCLRRSALLGMELVPSCTGNLRGTPLRTNSLGMRGPEVRDDGFARILVLGDSCTLGWRVDEAQAYPSVLQRMLRQSNTSERYQVLNAGVSGYTSY